MQRLLAARRGVAILRLVGSAAGVALLLRSINIGGSARAIQHAHPGLAVLGFVLTALGVAVAVRAWAAAIDATGSPVRLRRLGSLYLQGLFVGQVTPAGGGGDATRAIAMSREIGAGAGVASTAVSRLATGAAMAVCGVGGVLAARALDSTQLLAAAGALLLVIVAAVSALVVAHRYTGTLARSRFRPVARAAAAVHPVAESVRSMRRAPRAVAWCATLALLAWVLHLLALQTFAAAVGVHQPIGIFAVVVPLSLLATLAPFSVNGIGLREGVLVGLLIHLGSNAVNAGALALLADLQLVPFAAVGAVLLTRARRLQPAATAG